MIVIEKKRKQPEQEADPEKPSHWKEPRLRDLHNFEERRHIIMEKSQSMQRPYFSSSFYDKFDSRGRGLGRRDFRAAGASKANVRIPKERGKGKHSMSKKNL
ncbi:hypothetical protein SADUNF_Sadunf04G0051100 [Salix dunnii]|uniref:Uncharacterized protein n=1 Tax=Salix dunnii TaxID=1413687 RepID=A0A835K3Y4_9ROSI|nr:hypothetical protein SADUNF_Sadunf04G0051100 [Salix dunnii]